MEVVYESFISKRPKSVKNNKEYEWRWTCDNCGSRMNVLESEMVKEIFIDGAKNFQIPEGPGFERFAKLNRYEVVCPCCGERMERFVCYVEATQNWTRKEGDEVPSFVKKFELGHNWLEPPKHPILFVQNRHKTFAEMNQISLE